MKRFFDCLQSVLSLLITSNRVSSVLKFRHTVVSSQSQVGAHRVREQSAQYEVKVFYGSVLQLCMRSRVNVFCPNLLASCSCSSE